MASNATSVVSAFAGRHHAVVVLPITDARIAWAEGRAMTLEQAIEYALAQEAT